MTQRITHQTYHCVGSEYYEWLAGQEEVKP